MKLNEKLKAVRESKGMSQEALYYESGVRVATISRLENEHHLPDLGTLKALATSFNMTVRELLKDVDL